MVELEVCYKLFPTYNTCPDNDKLLEVKTLN